MVYVAFDIYPAATPNGTLLVRLTTSEGVELSCKKVLHGTGEGTIRIHSSHPDATTTNFAKRNYVKVVIVNGATETEWFGFFLEQGDFGAISRREQGGRMLTFTGLGSLFYLDRAVLLEGFYAPGQPRRGNLVIDGTWGWNDVPYGAIMVRALEEGIYAPGSPLSEATADFTRDDDSDGNPWPNIDNEFTVPWGTSVYEIVAAFIRLGLIVTVDPDLTFHAWQSYGTNRTSATFAAGKVRYEHGVNIGNEVVRQIRASLERSHIFVVGDEFTTEVASGGSSSVTYYDTLQKRETNDPATLFAAGQRDLAQREIQSDAAFPVRVVIDDDELNGRYVPGEHYDVGDIVTIDTVPPSGASGDHDYVNFAIEVAAIKLEHDDAGNWFAVNELGAQYLTAQLSAFEVASNRVINQIELCRPMEVGAPAIEHAAFVVGGTSAQAITVPTGGADSLLVVFGAWHSSQPYTGTYGSALTPIAGSQVTNTDAGMRAFYFEDPPQDVGGTGTLLQVLDAGAGGTWKGYFVLSGVPSGASITDVATASGTGTAATVTVPGTGGVVINAAWQASGTALGDPVAGAGQTDAWSNNFNPGGLEFGGGYGDDSPSWTFSKSEPWVMVGLRVIGSAAVGDEGPADTVLQGDETHGTSIRATRCDHAHAHGLLCDHGTHYHEVDQVHGAAGDLSAIDFLVGTASGSLSGEIVVGTTPGGELGNTWASPTVDSTHAGSNHLQPVRKNSTGSVFTRRQLNFIEGSNVTLTVADDAGNDEVDITIASSASGGSLTVEEEDGTPTGTPDTLKFPNGTVTDNGDGSFSIDNSGSGGGNWTSEPERWDLSEAPGSPEAENDEFEDASISGSFTRVYNSGAAKGSFAERYGAISYHQTVLTGTELDVYAQARTISVGDYVEVCGRIGVPSGGLAGIALGFSNGTTYGTSNALSLYWHSTGHTNRFMLNNWPGHNSRATDGTILDRGSTGTRWFVRVKYEASNTWGLYISFNGHQWHTVQSNYSYTMTPTHVIFGMAALAQAAPNWMLFDYFRVNAA